MGDGWAPVMVALIVSIAPTMMAYASLRQSQKNSTKQDQLAVKTEEIHRLTNGNASIGREELKAANDHVKALEGEVRDMKKLVTDLIAAQSTQGTK